MLFTPIKVCLHFALKLSYDFEGSTALANANGNNPVDRVDFDGNGKGQ